MKVLSFVFISLVTLANLISSQKSLSEKCDTCKSFTKKFIDGLDRTKKGNFGGGNTDWEDRKLGKYLTSETRFEEIFEKLCDEKDYECHKIMENNEDLLLDFYKEKQSELTKFLDEKFCIETLKFCCSKDSYGPSCSPCKKGTFNLICSDNGVCNGSGTREGTGCCDCNHGYAGDQCNKCAKYFFEKSENKCEACHVSCGSCANETKCFTCKKGYEFATNNGLCQDINECNGNSCDENQECKNKEGSFECEESIKKKGKTEAKADPDFKSKKLLFQRTVIIGVSLLCTLSALFARQYALAALAFSFGILINLII